MGCSRTREKKDERRERLCVQSIRQCPSRWSVRCSCYEGGFDARGARARLAALTEQSTASDFWDDADGAARVLRERGLLEEQVSALDALTRASEDAQTLLELAESEGDESALQEGEEGLRQAEAKARQMALQAMLSGEADSNDAYLEINAGAGGTEAQDWARMLERMYLRWAEQRGFKAEILHESAGEEAGLKSATLRIEGAYAFGWLRPESGVHRLVRISPFDAQKRRHTSFASVWVWPVVDDSVNIDIQDKDLRIDTYRASGAGGQHVNRTDSAIRITHLPSGIVVQCQSDRSQHRNRATAFDMLRARLFEAEMRRRQEAAQAESAGKSDISWGHQIRSYVLQPYRMVKDTRTSLESSQVDAVLDGALDDFLEAALSHEAQDTNT